MGAVAAQNATTTENGDSDDGSSIERPRLGVRLQA